MCGLAFFSCARQFKPTFLPPKNLAPVDYSEVLKTWTREGQGYSGLEHKITVKATLISPMLRRAFSVRFPEVYGYGGQITRTEMRDVSPETESTLNFFVAVYTADFRWNDFNKTTSIWHVTLDILDGFDGKSTQSFDTTAIERVKIDENMRTIYPYMNTFETGYLFRFPMQDAASQPILKDKVTYVRLRIASSFAERDLDWTIEP